MTLIELKKFITDGVTPTAFMIFINKDNKFLARQYVEALGKGYENGICKITSIYEPQQSSILLLTRQENTLNVLYVDTFDERAESYSQFENTIVVCEQIDKSIEKDVESFVIKFPKFEEWQILDYAKMLCPAVEEADLLWLIKTTEYNIERILNELAKVSIFNKIEQQSIFAALRFDPQTDLYIQQKLYTIADALVDGNLPVLLEFVRHNNYESFEPVALVNIALTKLKNIILAAKNPNLSAEDCGMSDKQYKFFVSKYRRNLNVEAAKQKIKFLTNLDLDLKSSKLGLSKPAMFSYMVSHLAYKITL